MSHGHEHDEHKPPANGPGYETEDASFREVMLTGVFLAIGTIIVCGAVFGFFKVMGAAEERSRTTTTYVPRAEAFPPSPRVEEQPWLEFRNMRAHENQMMSTYTWVDKNSGKVRIPIERAMDMVLQQGLPVRTAGGEMAGSGKPKSGRDQGNVPDQATGVKRNAPRK